MSAPISRPGTPAQKSVQRHPIHPASTPPPIRPIDAPTGAPSEKVASAPERRSGGKLSAISACDGGPPPASPTPTPIRSNSSWTRSEEHTSELQSLKRISYDVA